MVQDAEANADADKERREAIDVKNQLDSVIYGAEKTIRENKEKLPKKQFLRIIKRNLLRGITW